MDTVGWSRRACSARVPGASLAVATALLLAAPAAAQMGQPSPTEKALERAEKALQSEPGLNAETREALKELIQALRAERAAAAKAGAPPAGPGGAGTQPRTRDRLSVLGDFRLRHESSFSQDNLPDRHRERVRFRLGANYKISDEVLVGARVATGPRTDAQSPHQTLGEVFHKFELNLDRAFASYRPRAIPGLSLTAGKFGHPFWMNPVYGELVWDADVQPEGIVLGHTVKGGGALDRIDLALGQYLLLEQGAGSEASAFVAQAVAHGVLGKRWRPSLGVGYYRYSDLTPDRSQSTVGENSGNLLEGTGPGTDFASRFEILNPIFALSYNTGRYPLVLSAEYIKNLRAANSDDTGWAAGVAFGAAQKKGDWRVYYQRQTIEQESVLSVVSQDDFLFSTNHRSHVFGVNYQVRDNLGVHLWGLVSQRDRLPAGTDRDSQWRVRLDTNLRF